MTYSKVQIALHWIMAIMVFGMAAAGLAYRYDWVGNNVLIIHQYAGQVLIVLLVIRVILRFLRPPPAASSHHSMWEKRLASTVHFGLYLCLIAFVITGYVSASALSDTALLFPVDRAFARSERGELLLDAHYALKWVLLGLFTLHFAGTIKHSLIDRDDTLARMLAPKK